mmetsp:Transcript_58510/g.161882  ORF Transcript_58510/g.161882 Transcript_58510/m.161882 type:complete len:301 (-) Transcript_58510:202-1104(-)
MPRARAARAVGAVSRGGVLLGEGRALLWAVLLHAGPPGVELRGAHGERDVGPEAVLVGSRAVQTVVGPEGLRGVLRFLLAAPRVRYRRRAHGEVGGGHARRQRRMGSWYPLGVRGGLGRTPGPHILQPPRFRRGVQRPGRLGARAGGRLWAATHSQALAPFRRGGLASIGCDPRRARHEGALPRVSGEGAVQPHHALRRHVRRGCRGRGATPWSVRHGRGGVFRRGDRDERVRHCHPLEHLGARLQCLRDLGWRPAGPPSRRPAHLPGAVGAIGCGGPVLPPRPLNPGVLLLVLAVALRC